MSGTATLDAPYLDDRPSEGRPSARNDRLSRIREQAPGLMLAAPAAVLISIFFLYPVISLITTSLRDPASQAFSAEIYIGILSDSFYREMLYRTLRTALLVTFITLVAAFPVALYARQLPPQRRTILSLLLLSPLMISVVVRTLGWVVLLAPAGIVATFLNNRGIPAPQMLYTSSAVVIGLVHVFFGYMTLSLMISALKIDENLLLAAADLGANRWTTMSTVVMPLMLPGIRAGSMITFALAGSAYVTPALLGGGRRPVFAQRIFEEALFYVDFPRSAAFATILLVVVLAGMFLISFLTRSASERADAANKGRGGRG